jgi:hypothetical protein
VHEALRILQTSQSKGSIPMTPRSTDEVEELREAAKAVGSALDDWIKIIDIRAPLNPDLKHYFWKRDPTWDEAQEAMRANNELAECLAKLSHGSVGHE